MKLLEKEHQLDIRLYHPIPFEKYEWIKELNKKARRLDSEQRFLAIKNNYGDFSGKSLIDICCANGYFLFRFMQEGGLKGFGVETDTFHLDFINKVAVGENLDIIAVNFLPELVSGDSFDIGIFLDTYHKDNIELKDYPHFIGKKCKVAFVSDTNNHGGKIEDLLDILKEYYKNIEFVYEGFVGRKIYKCSN